MISRDIALVDEDWVVPGAEYRFERSPTLSELNLKEFVHDDEDFEETIAHYKRITEK